MRPEKQGFIDYENIKAWGHMSGSKDYYIEAQVRKARQDGASQDAVYFSPDQNRWVCLSECCDMTQWRMENTKGMLRRWMA